MPSVNNICELVYFGLIAAGLTVVILLGVKYSPAGRSKEEEGGNDSFYLLSYYQRWVWSR
jgi:hypothetical protein